MTTDRALLSMTFAEHLAELRRRVIRCLIALGAASSICYLRSETLLAWLLRPLSEPVGQLYFFSPQEAFVVRIKTALFCGALLTAPWMFAQLWLFVAPGLRDGERRMILPLTAMTTVFFAAGAAFSYWIVIPVALSFLLSMGSDLLRPMISVTEYVSFVSTMTIAFGIAFNLPVFLLGAVSAGVLSDRVLAAHRRHAVVVAFIAAALLTPGPDVASQVLLAIPLIVLYEISVQGARWVAPKRRGAVSRV